MSEPERRELNFANMEDVTADIEKLAGGEVRTVGKQSFSAIVRHLAIANEMINGKLTPPKLPWYMRLAMPFLRNSIFNGPVKPGFKLPSDQMQTFFWPEEPIEVSEAVARFKSSVDQYKSQGPPNRHPLFGPGEPEVIDKMLLKHAAMHLSFVHPA